VLVTASLNSAVDGVTANITHVSAHTAYSSAGANEVTGGSPAYARKAVGWDAAASRIGDNTALFTFDIPAGTTIAWLGLFSALTAGTFYGMAPIGSTISLVSAVDATANTIYSPGHGLANDDKVVMTPYDGGAMPGGLTEGTEYFVVGATTDSLQVSTTSGGAAIAISSSALVMLQNIVTETFGSQGTATVAAGAFDFIGLV